MLNPTQQAVVDFGDGPALVIAGAGTGKTRVLVSRAARLVERGVTPNRILLITFTRKSAQEIRERIIRLCPTGGGTPWCGTFHATSARLLRTFGASIAISPNFSILDEADVRELMTSIVSDMFPEPEQRSHLPKKTSFPGIHSYWVNSQRDFFAVLNERYPAYVNVAEDIQAVFKEYRKRKKQSEAYDYDDLLVLWVKLLRRGPARLRQLFDYVMVDEYQDTNPLQSEILKGLYQGTHNVMVVGDDAQAIYAFRGATVENIFRFENDFPGTTRMKLEINYRSTQGILDISNSLLAEASEGFRKELASHRGKGERPEYLLCRDEWDQAERIVQGVLARWQQDGTPLREQAVLFRSSYHSFKIEMGLQRYDIPYKKFGGIRLADSAHVKDVMAFLRCRENPWDETAWRRVLELIPGVGQATSRRFYDRIRKAEAPPQLLASMRFPKRAGEWVASFLDTVNVLFAAVEVSFNVQFDAVFAFYEKLLPFLHENPKERLLELRMLRELARRYESRREFLDDVVVGDNSVFRPVDDEPEDYLTLSTIHSAKGCEWDCVYVIQLVEGGLPIIGDFDDGSKEAEERRLLYVAMTRARNELLLYGPESRQSADPMEYATPCMRSRFLSGAVLAHCAGVEGVEQVETGSSSAPELIYDFDDVDL